MKAIIVYFSPGGNTQKAAKMFASVMEEKFEEVESINLTRNESYWNSSSFRNNLYQVINTFDVLLVGCPVYAHHLQYNMINFLKALLPVNNGEQIAIPFVTYGGINSGEALHEAEILLKKTGRKVAAGIKLNSEHSLARGLSSDYNKGLPNESIIPSFKELIKNLSLTISTGRQQKDFLLYHRLPVRIRTKLLIGEKFWHKFMYPEQKFDYSKCNGCGICAKKCPLMRIEMRNNKPYIKENAKDCIHCGNCIFSCKTGGNNFDGDMKKWEKLFIRATQGKGPIVSNEEPKTKIYYAV